MKYLFSTSKNILLINLVTAILVTLALSNFVFSFQETYINPNGCSKNAVSFIFEGNEADALDLFSHVSTIKEDYTFWKQKDESTYGVVANCDLTYPKIIEGRNLNVHDHNSNNYTAIVAFDYRQNCIASNGKSWIEIGGATYEVVGFFEYKYSPVCTNASVIYNLGINNLSQHAEEKYYLDVGNSTSQEIQKIAELFPISQIKSQEYITISDRLSTAFFSQSITILPLLLVTAMVLLNSINISFDWIERRKKELKARSICGARKYQLMRQLFWDYIGLTTVSYCIGLVPVVMLSKVESYLFVGFDFSVLTIILSYITTTFISLLSIFVLFCFGGLNSICGKGSGLS